MIAAEHEQLAEAATKKLSGLQQRSLIFGLCRLIVFVVLFLATAQLAGGAGMLALLSAGFCLVLFLYLTVCHVALDERLAAQRARIAYHQRGQERMAGNWQHQQDDGSGFVEQWHPYAHDLDLIGPHGFYALLNTAGSAAGRKVLARYLFDDAYIAAEEQTDAVQKLAQHSERRAAWSCALEQESRLWSGAEESVADAAYIAWLAASSVQPMPTLLIHVLRVVIALLVAAGFVLFGVTWLWTGCIIIAIFASVLNDRASLAFHELKIDHNVRLLRSWQRALQVLLEAEAQSECLSADLHAAMQKMQAQLQRQLKMWHGLSLRANPFWRYGLGALLLADWHYCRRLMNWRQQEAGAFADSLPLLGEIDALHACATYAAEQGGVWAATAAPTADTLFEADDLAHPLLAVEKRVGNTIALQRGQVLLLTGANASGKSTFLRSIAFAVLMARMGLPVCARRCSLQQQRLATVMRIHDALWQGMSRFQAEVKQLKLVLDRSASAGNPVVLILDEILAGTNSEERRIGSLAFMRHLRDYQGLILITTHDLALADIATEEPERICCYHFADRAQLDAEQADVLFDYKLRSGVLQSTNALQVMQAAGLPIE